MARYLLLAAFAAVLIVGCGSDAGDASKPVDPGSVKAPDSAAGGPSLGGTADAK